MIRVLLLLLLALSPAQAAGEGGHGQPKAEGGVGAPGTNVDMPYLMAPVIDADSKLMGYAYIFGRLTATSADTVLAVRDKLAFIQDAFVRDVNDHPVMGPVTGPDDPEKTDIPGLESRLLADARKVMGAGKIKAYTICTIQMAPLRPKPQAAPTDPNAPPQKSRCVKQAVQN